MTSSPPPNTAPSARTGWRAIPGSVWALGFVSMFMDISSEMIHALLPIYMVTVLGTSALSVGLIEGIAEATASITKVFSGALSDKLGHRKLLAVVGYGLGALTKPVFPLAGSLEWLVGARFVDRVGKGIRGAPRDALVADVTPPALRGAAYGLRQTLDTIGSFTGPLIAMGLMWWTANHYQTVFWVAVVPAFVAVALLVLFVREPRRAAAAATGPPASRCSAARSRASGRPTGRSWRWASCSRWPASAKPS
jgi:predicted MFS family arabinose efflux permease